MFRVFWGLRFIAVRVFGLGFRDVHLGLFKGLAAGLHRHMTTL